ncbi:hypothetical protein BP5796_05303 [Coleophoma crateriformis]|uniref:Uncharacterized protein n=1 Tax=Coleophoma crateriformis TaxID=565419 RepID=A0A3D8S2V1_9HELO|nr:hypothetical protein BP5796_05303 [Coleophoma crateriformis]
MAPQPPSSYIALPPALPTELLDYVLAHQAYPTTLVICTTRAQFLDSLLRSLQNDKSPGAEDVSLPPPSSPDADPLVAPALHPFLVPTLHQLAISRYVDTVFIPTLAHLRAYLSVFGNGSSTTENGEQGRPEMRPWDKPGRNRPLLVVYGLLDLHRDTSEWSAQGLGISMAALVEAGKRGGRGVVVMEGKGEDAGGDEKLEEAAGDGETDLGEVNVGHREGKAQIWKGWFERMPMLNGSARRVGFESEDGGWSGRTVEVGRVLGRWFRFGRADWDEE